MLIYEPTFKRHRHSALPIVVDGILSNASQKFLHHIMMVHYFRRFERLLERYDPESDVFVKPCVHSKIWDTHIISMHKKPYQGHDVNQNVRASGS